MVTIFHETREEEFLIVINHTYPNHTQIYVDASKKEFNTIAIFIPKLAIQEIYHPVQTLEIFSLEAFAILLALNLIDKHNLNNSIIFSDNKSVLTLLKHPNYTLLRKNPRPILITEIREKIQPSTMICWIPGHSKVTKHIITDNLTKTISNEQIDKSFYVELEEIHLILQKKFETIWFETWNKMRGITEYKKIHNPVKLNKPHFITKLNRKSEIITNRLRLASNQLNYYLFKIGKTQTTLCDVCNVDETTEHLLTVCKKTKILIDKVKQETKQSKTELIPTTILENTKLIQETIRFFKSNQISI